MWDFRSGSREQRLLSDLATHGDPGVPVCEDCGRFWVPFVIEDRPPMRVSIRATL